MFLCKVTGTVVSTRKSERFRTAKLLIVHRVDSEGALVGSRDMLALDPKFDAGVGDYVLVAKEGAVVAQLMDDAAKGSPDATPANVIITGVVDDWALGG
jgi:microcompartment protein CcmK/EutM